jgi:hypothetical protein
LSKEDVLKNSPSTNGDYIKVPLTVKKENQWYLVLFLLD